MRSFMQQTISIAPTSSYQQQTSKFVRFLHSRTCLMSEVYKRKRCSSWLILTIQLTFQSRYPKTWLWLVDCRSWIRNRYPRTSKSLSIPDAREQFCFLWAPTF
uniref:(northern house mosquito) hypothetical protein n=1 Tax=Culex pipiens TaxID=7175 RepID=A0A8D8DXM1_CULPI